MALIGHVSQGTTNSGPLTGDRKLALKVTAPETGTITAMFCDMQNDSLDSIQAFRAGVYNDAVNVTAATLVGSSDDVLLSPGMTRQWVTFPNMNAGQVAGSSYWLTLHVGLIGG